MKDRSGACDVWWYKGVMLGDVEEKGEGAITVVSLFGVYLAGEEVEVGHAVGEMNSCGVCVCVWVCVCGCVCVCVESGLLLCEYTIVFYIKNNNTIWLIDKKH